MAHLVALAPQWLGWQGLCNNQTKQEEVKRRSPSRRELATRWRNWWHQLCNGQGGSNNDNGDGGNNNNNDIETMTMITTTTAAGTVRINAGTDLAAVLCQGLTTQGKCGQRQC
jgi:hypothetical protein